MTGQTEFDFSQSDTCTIERDGFTITARLKHDTDHRAPWDECDGHGPVSDWTRRAKAPSELLLAGDMGGHRRYYDLAGAQRIALRDQWGVNGVDRESMTPRAYAALAARRDFDYLQSWCNDEWHYVGVVLSVARNGITLDSHAAALWGIESNATAYLGEVAADLLEEALGVGKAAIASLCDCDGESA